MHVFQQIYLNCPFLKNDFNEIKKGLGKATYKIPASAKPGLTGRRSLYITKNIKKGGKFTKENVRSIRPHYGLHPKYLNKILNKKSKKKISRLELN